MTRLFALVICMMVAGTSAHAEPAEHKYRKQLREWLYPTPKAAPPPVVAVPDPAPAPAPAPAVPPAAVAPPPLPPPLPVRPVVERPPLPTIAAPAPIMVERPAKQRPKPKPKPKAPQRVDDAGPDLPWPCWMVRMHAAGKTRKQLEDEGRERGIKLTPKQTRQAIACLK